MVPIAFPLFHKSLHQILGIDLGTAKSHSFCVVCLIDLRSKPPLNKVEAFLIRLACLISLTMLLVFALWTEFHHLFR